MLLSALELNRKQEELLANEGYAYREKEEGRCMQRYMDSALLKPVKDENEFKLHFNGKQ